MLAHFGCGLEFLIRLFKLCDLCRQLRIASVMFVRRVSVALPCKGIFMSSSLSYLRCSPVLWVLCMPPCCLHRAQCIASLRGSFGICLLKVTTLFLEEPPPVALALGPSHSFSVGKAFLMHSSAYRHSGVQLSS